MTSSRTTFKLLLGIVILACVSLPSVQAAPTLDLSTAGSSGFVKGAYFAQDGNGSSGTGTIHSFVRISTNDGIEQGYNTDWRPIELGFNMNNSPTFTRSLLLSDVPIVNKGGIDYREFRLDINQSNGSHALLSLDAIEIYLAASGSLTGYPALGTKIFDLDGPTSDNWILLNGDLVAGSGGGQDMTAFIPDSLFVGGDYVYLYSKFGASEGSLHPNNDGFEEWSVRKDVLPPPPVPVPSALLLAAMGSHLAIWFHRRKPA
jgi:hypothetical protein